MSDSADEQAGRQMVESWAADRVKRWPRKLQIDDYDFRSWGENANKNRLQAGAVYEYARESRKLRCLLAVMNPKRPRDPWEIMRPGSIDGRRPNQGEIESYPPEANWLPCSFDGLNEREAERALHGFFYCLCDLADSLADNISFAALFRMKRDELEKAFGGLDSLSRVKREFRYFMPIDDAVEVAAQSEVEDATVEETLEDEKSAEKRLILRSACSEVIAIKIRWRFTNSQITRAVRKLVRAMRPETCKPVQRKKGSRLASPRAALDALSAMRLASYVPKISAANSEAWSSYLADDFEGIQFQASAIGLFEMIRLGGHRKHIAESNFDALVNGAREVFKESFPFGEDTANTVSFKDRVMMKSEQVSSQDKV
jgi:hypothetical protein